MPLKTILEHYAREALKQARYKQLEDGSFVGRVPALKGVIAFGADRQRCQEELLSVIEDWARLGIQNGANLPVIGDVDLNTDETQVVSRC